jgi:hypothetical protein
MTQKRAWRLHGGEKGLMDEWINGLMDEWMNGYFCLNQDSQDFEINRIVV